MPIYAKEFFAFKDFRHIFWGIPKPQFILTDNKSVTRFCKTKTIPPTLWNACDYVIQFNVIMRTFLAKKAAEYLSRREISPKEKLNLKLREEIPITQNELRVQSAGVMEEDVDDNEDEAEEQIWQRKRSQN